MKSPVTSASRSIPTPTAPSAGPLFTPAMPFIAVLFLASMGGVFFRMARDNDDVIRMVLVLVAAGALSFVVAVRGAAMRASLTLPALGYGVAMLASAVLSPNPVESLREFLKVGAYLLIYLALATRAHDVPAPGSSTRRRWLAAGLGGAGALLGYVHVTDTTGRFRLWTDPQVIASLVSSGLLCAAFCLWQADGSVRRAVIRAGGWLAVIVCGLGLLQFYGLDLLRPWDEPAWKSYPFYLSGRIAEWLEPATAGRFVAGPAGPRLELPRILGIHGNPDFFAAHLLQFIPLAVAACALDPARRRPAALVTAMLLLTMGLTDVSGAWFALIAASPVLGALVGYCEGPLAPAALRPLRARFAWLGGATVALFLASRAVHDLFPTLFMIAFAASAGCAGWALSRVFRARIVLATGVVAAVGVILLIVLGASWQRGGHKSASITERLVKSLMATAMWRAEPVHGVGLNAYKSRYPAIQQAVRLPRAIPFEDLGSSFTQENRTHNDFMQMLAETGVAGMGMFLWFMGTLLWHALTRLRAGTGLSPRDRADLVGLLGGVLVTLIYAVPNFPFHIVSLAATFWIMAGLLASYGAPAPAPAPATAAVNPPAPFAALPFRLRLLTVPAAAAYLLLTGLTGWNLIEATLDHKRADFFSVKLNPPDRSKAAWHYERAAARDPYNAQIAYDFGATCYNGAEAFPELGRKAGPLFARARALGFVNDDLEYGIGFLAEREGRLDDALARYTAACALNERHVGARQGRFRLWLRAAGRAESALAGGRFAEARRLYHEALRRDPDNPGLLFRSGTLSLAPFNDLATGLPCLERAARAVGNEPVMWLALGRAYAAARRLAEAHEALATALLLDPRNGEVRSAHDAVEALRHPARHASLPAAGAGGTRS